ncbi:MAG: RCKP-type rubredoxin-like domain-containing protein [Caldimicrobium sp.]
MALWKCSKCGATKDARCKPRKCPECGEAGTMVKEEAQAETSQKKGCGSKRSCKKKAS